MPGAGSHPANPAVAPWPAERHTQDYVGHDTTTQPPDGTGLAGQASAQHAAFHPYLLRLAVVENFFGIITGQAIRRGTVTSVTDLEGAIRDFIDAHNQRAHPVTWTTAED